MFFLLIEFDLVAQIVNRAIDTHAHIARAPHLFEDLLVFALASLHQGCKQQNTRPLRQIEYRVYNLLDRLLGYFPSTLGTMRMTNTRIEQAQIVIDLGYGTNR